MKFYKIFLIILKCFYWFCKLFGLLPIHYNSRKNAFNWSKLEILYSIFVLVNFSYFSRTNGLSIVIHLNPVLVLAVFYMAIASITMVFTIQCYNAKKLAVLMNETRILLIELLPFCHSISTWQSAQCGIMFICKTVVASGLALIGVISCCVILCKMMTGKVDLFVIFIISITHFLQTLVPNMFYTFVLGASMQYHQLNGEIQKIANRAVFLMKNQMNKNSIYQFRKLSRRLDYIASIHGKLTIHTKKINEIFAWHLLIIIANFFAILLIEVGVCMYFCSFLIICSAKNRMKTVFFWSLRRVEPN